MTTFNANLGHLNELLIQETYSSPETLFRTHILPPLDAHCSRDNYRKCPRVVLFQFILQIAILCLVAGLQPISGLRVLHIVISNISKFFWPLAKSPIPSCCLLSDALGILSSSSVTQLGSVSLRPRFSSSSAIVPPCGGVLDSTTGALARWRIGELIVA